MSKSIFVNILFFGNKISKVAGLVSYYIYPPSICKIVDNLFNSFYSGRVTRRLAKCGENLYVKRRIYLWHPKNIEVGNNVEIHKNAILATHSNTSNLLIGDGATIGENCHITCVSKIIIGKGVLMGKKCIITDNSHGNIDYESVLIPPGKREVVSGGEVVIAQNVWLGDNVVVLPGVTIGEGSVIGASSVVTKSIPEYSVCVGNPARVVRSLK